MPGIYPYIKTPPKGVAAFQKSDEISSQSQAAVLLMLGRQLRGDDASLRARASAAGRTTSLALASHAEFPVPHIKATATRVHAGDTRQRLAKLDAFKPAAKPEIWAKSYLSCAQRLYKKPTTEAVAHLCEVCLDHPKDLVKIAAAFVYHRLSTEPDRLLKILAAGVKSSDELERDLAATALARVAPEHPALGPLRKGKIPAKPPKPAHTITIIHGTWASGNAWYQPNGDFFNYIGTLRPDLYSNGDFFRWTGGYSDAARTDGGKRLVEWVAAHNEAGLDLIAHSHGASVCMLATQLGMQMGKLVLLSCPVHVDQYMPNFANIQKGVYSIHVKLDLVILADRGGQKFNRVCLLYDDAQPVANL